MRTDVATLAIPMADELAAIDLICSTTPLVIEKLCWLDITSELGRESVGQIRERAVQYLSLRGRLARHPRFPNLVRIQGVEHVQPR